MKKSYFNQIKKDFTDDDILNKLYDNMNLGIIDKKKHILVNGLWE